MTGKGIAVQRRTALKKYNRDTAAVEQIMPDSSRLIDALRQIGYSFEQAVADLVDNSISAGANLVLIRFFHDRENITSVAVVDNGSGMTEKEMVNAMRFGSDPRKDIASLGKFGMGLKLASLSHAGILTVTSKRNGRVSSRKWTLDGIRDDWKCETPERESTLATFNAPWSPIAPENCGTVIFWEEIDKLPASAKGIRYTLRSLHQRLSLHLGLHFHRFLESGRLRLFVDQQVPGESEHQIRAEITALNPFGYDKSGAKGYPKDFAAEIYQVGKIKLQGHIWPANSEMKEYRLGGKTASRQGFYFYRNDRLIQAGGWNGLVQNESEPHGSLARVMVDLPVDLDESFSLNVQKSSVIVPPGFTDAVRLAVCGKGDKFEDYRHLAGKVYRESDKKTVARKALVPGSGVPAAFRKRMLGLAEIDIENTVEVDFSWRDLEHSELFRVEDGAIILNEYYRYDLMPGMNHGRNDLPFYKMLILMLLENDIRRPPGKKRLKEIGLMNQILIDALGS